MKKIFTKEFIIGLCVIAAIVILCIGIEFLKGINVFKPANFYIARYDNVMGLETAAPVMIDGYKVGQVRYIEFNYEHPGPIEVHLALNKHLRIPADSKAVIGSTLLSGSYVEIEMGHSTQMIEVGGDIATEVAPDLMSSLSDDLLPSVSSVIPKIDSLLVSINRLVSDPALLASVQNLQGITDNVYSASASLNTLMKRDIPGLMGNVDNVVVNLDSISKDLMVLSSQLKSLPLNSTMDNVNGMTENLLQFSNKLNDSNSTLGKIMNDPELYNSVNRLTSDIDSLILDIKKNPKRYISIKLL